MDMSKVIIPKSDQLNSDDLIAGPRTITIREVAIKAGEQPVSIFYDGDEGKPWKPCKSMARVLVAAWGPDAKVYVGRTLTLYRDPNVKWAGMAVGGIRISHMSNIESKMTLALTETRGSRKPYSVLPLVVQQAAKQQQAATPEPDVQPAQDMKDAAEQAAKGGVAALEDWWGGLSKAEKIAMKLYMEPYKKAAAEVDAAADDDDTKL